MAWRTSGLRGSTFEDMINYTNRMYIERGTAVIQKIPTPITPINIDKRKGQITLAYFSQDSTVDYIGVAKGKAICFDAKESKQTTFPLSNIHKHQVKFMCQFAENGGISFILIRYVEENKIYFMSIQELMQFWNRMLEGGRKSFRMDELKQENFLDVKKATVMVPYIEKALTSAENIYQEKEENHEGRNSVL